MSIKWFSTASNPFKGKIKPRVAPSAPKTKKPVYKKTPHRQRMQRIKKPRVDSPFSAETPAVASLSDVTAASGPDTSAEDLRIINSGSSIVNIEWKYSGEDGCSGARYYERDLDCSMMDGTTWDSLKEFLGERNLSMAKGRDVGMYGFSHPGCTCHIMVHTEDGQSHKLGPYS